MQKRLTIEEYEATGRYLINPSTGCWLWQGVVGPAGYPKRQSRTSRNINVRRVIFEHYKGKIPRGSILVSICARTCCNPAHMRVQRPRTDYGAPCEYQNPPWIVDPESGCWLWVKSTNSLGYPIVCRQFAKGRFRTCIASRAIYQDHKGRIPAGTILRRTCKSGKACVNPDHARPFRRP
jgi:hypothetical protein